MVFAVRVGLCCRWDRCAAAQQLVVQHARVCAYVCCVSEMKTAAAMVGGVRRAWLPLGQVRCSNLWV